MAYLFAPYYIITLVLCKHSRKKCLSNV